MDNFAGGGGASTAIDLALGRDPEEAINHDPIAIAMHMANHPQTRHWCQNVWQADPYAVADKRPVGLAWFSPDCTHHSKAKGGKPLESRRRDLAWVAVSWGRTVHPRIMMIENVEEFADWGPLIEGRLCPDRRGQTFKRWVRELRRLGYRVEWNELRAADYGAPTTRKRLFLVARNDGAPIKWPDATHARAGNGGLQTWRSAAEIIDWNLACHSIFLSSERARDLGIRRPLAEKTMARIAAGVRRYVLDAAEPFIVPITHGGSIRLHGINEPVRTVTTAHRGEFSLVTPFLAPRFAAATLITNTSKHAPSSVRGPVPTLATGNHQAVVAAFMAQHNGGMVGHEAKHPVSTITERGTQQAIVAAHMVNLKGRDRRDRAAGEPAFTVTSGGNHIAEVRSFLIKYHGSGTQWQDARAPLLTADSHGRFGVVKVYGQLWQLADIGMRMLVPRELFNAQAFPAGYKIDVEYKGKPISKTAQVMLCGNSVSPPPAVALLKANIFEAPKMRNNNRKVIPLFERAA